MAHIPIGASRGVLFQFTSPYRPLDMQYIMGGGNFSLLNWRRSLSIFPIAFVNNFRALPSKLRISPRVTLRWYE